MKVLHIGVGNMYGGIESHMVCLARSRALAQEMETAFAVCFEGRLNDELHASGAAVHMLCPMRASRPWTVWRGRRALRELLHRERFDAVICHAPWSYALLAPAVRESGVKLFIWCHAAMNSNDWIERRAKRIKPDGIIANSRHTAAALPALFPEVKIEVIHCAVEPPHVVDPDNVSVQVRAALNTRVEDVVILQVSRIEELKGHRTLLDALAELRDVPNWTCWIAGGPQRPPEQRYFEELQAQAARLKLNGRLHFLGERKDVPRLMAAADIVCQPNVAPDSFGIVFIEALYAGKPVVASGIGGALEILDNTFGALVPAGETAGLARELRNLIWNKEERREKGRRGPARAGELCSPCTTLRRLSQVLAA